MQDGLWDTAVKEGERNDKEDEKVVFIGYWCSAFSLDRICNPK